MPKSRTSIDFTQSHLELHDLCQPLTALQCRLELAEMIGNPEAFEEAVKGGLEETRRMFDIIAHMRQRLLEMETEPLP